MEFFPLANPSSAYYQRRIRVLEQDLVSRLERPAYPSNGLDFSLRLASANCGPIQERGIQLPRVPGHCDLCFTTDTPLWRKGPNGPKTFCNACGIRYKKELKKVKLTLGSTSACQKAKSS